MQNLQEKIKEKLLLADEDVEPLLQGDIKTLLSRNKEAAVRVALACGGCFVGLLIFLSVFSVFGAFGKIILIGAFFGTFGIMVLKHKADLLRATQYPVLSYFLIGFFGLMALSMFSSVSSQGSFFSKLLMLLVIGGVVGGIYTVRSKIADLGVSVLQLVVAGLVVCSLLLSLQATAIQFSIDQEISMAQQRSEMRRQRDAEQMRHNQASTKVCSSEEECRKMNMKKNSYYAQYEEVAQEVCESAVAKEISGRFEWTVSAKDYKFNKYEVDVLKDEITLFGDRANLIANDGARTQLVYTCRYNTKKKTAQAAARQATKK